MTAGAHATGRTAEDGWVVFTRTFPAPIEDVWAAVTEPDRLARWIGTWTGDPSSGSVTFTMTAEGEDAPAETYLIEECRPPYRLLVTTVDEEGGTWRLRLELTEVDGTTALDFAQHLTDPDLATHVGPGWDYYLDRLVVAERGGDVASIDFADYHPALSEHYRRLVS